MKETVRSTSNPAYLVVNGFTYRAFSDLVDL